VTVGQGEHESPTAKPAPLNVFAAQSPQRLLVEAFLAPAARLLVAEAGERGGAPQVRVAHEALLTHWPKARETLAEAMSDLKLRARIEQAAEPWRSAAARDRGSFLLQPGRPLADAEDLLRRLGGELPQDVIAFIRASLRARRGALRRRYAVAAALSSGVAASLVVGYYYGRDWLAYRQERQIEAARTDLQGTTLAYSTSKGTVALDSLPGESNSPYLSALMRLIPDRTLDLNSLLLKVNQDVITRTHASGAFTQVTEFGTTLNGSIFLHDPPKSRKTFVLSIGVADYPDGCKLVTSPNDARKFADAMRELGYDVDLVLNPTRAQLSAAIDAFEGQIAQARNGSTSELISAGPTPAAHRGLARLETLPPSASFANSVALVYISATGFETGDEMWVAPTDFDAHGEYKDMTASMLSVNDLIDRLRKSTAVQIVIVDACRTPAGR
jgi:hypothetical protein